MTVAVFTSGRTFRSLRDHRNYRLWFTGQIVSVTGTWMQNVAQAWFIAVLTHSALAQGVLAACQFGPYFFFGLFGGAVTDRLSNRRTLIFTQSALMVSAIALGVLAIAGIAQPWEVFALAAFNGTIQVVDTPARQAFTVEMVGRDELPNAVALNASMFNGSRLIGPALAGLLIASVGVAICFLINALSFLAVLGALWLMNPAELYPPKGQARRRSLLRESVEGLTYVWRTPAIRQVMGMMLIVATVSMNFNVLTPVLTQKTLHAGAVTFGWLMAAFGGGALIGALVSATIGRASRAILLGGAAAFGITELVLAPLTNAWLCGALLLVNGIAFSLYTSMSNSTIQLAVPDRLRGRVMGIYGYVFFGTAPLGGLAAGWMASTGGTELAFGVAGVVATLVALAGTLGHQARRRRGVATGTVASTETSLLTRE